MRVGRTASDIHTCMHTCTHTHTPNTTNTHTIYTQQTHTGDVECSEWLQLLIGCVAFKQGLLQEVLSCLPAQEAALKNNSSGCRGNGDHSAAANGTHSAANGAHTSDSAHQSAAGNAQSPTFSMTESAHLSAESAHHSATDSNCAVESMQVRWSHHTPVLLHILAHELEAMVGDNRSSSKSTGESVMGSSSSDNRNSTQECFVDSSSSDRNNSIGKGETTGADDAQGVVGSSSSDNRNSTEGDGMSNNTSPPLLPWQRSLQCLVSQVVAAAGACKDVSVTATATPTAASMNAHTAAGACEGVTDAPTAVFQTAATTAPQTNAAATSQGERESFADGAGVAKHVLEAGLEVRSGYYLLSALMKASYVFCYFVLLTMRMAECVLEAGLEVRLNSVF